MSALCLVSRLTGDSLGAVFVWISCFGDGGVAETFVFDGEKILWVWIVLEFDL
jgi:hypothetical protein